MKDMKVIIPVKQGPKFSWFLNNLLRRGAKVWLVSKQIIETSQRDLWSRKSRITAVRTSDLYLVLVISLGNN